MLMRIVLEPAPIITNEELPDHFKIQMVEWYGTAIVTTFCPIILIGKLVNSFFRTKDEREFLDTTALHVDLYDKFLIGDASASRFLHLSLSLSLLRTV